jgi:apolipoprotein D and lipocalin family protein
MKRIAILLAMTALLASCAISNDSGNNKGMTTVKHVDLNRYMGDWYVIANIPNRMEKNCYDSIERYKLRDDGNVDNKFDCRDGSFDKPLENRLDTIATIYNKDTNAEWRVRIMKIIQAKYLVVDLDPNYEWTVVGHPSRDYGWVLARSKRLPEDVYASILERLGKQGYEVSRFVKIPQGPAT